MTNNYKVVLLGDSSVGKTSIVERITKNMFSADRQCTIGAAFTAHRFIRNGKEVVLDIWDTAGQERYHSLAPLYYRNADVAIVVYDVTKQESYERAVLWIEELKKLNKSCFMCLVGNKTDLKRKEQTELFVYETSAKTGEGIHELFQAIGDGVSGISPKRQSGISLFEIEQKVDCCFK